MKKGKPKKRQLIFDKEGIEAFALQIRMLRKELGMTQNQLAFESGISLSQVARIETARINPTLSTVFAIARALDLPLTSIFNFPLPENKKTEKNF